MKVYHRTGLEQMRSIRADGFKDDTRRYETDREWPGVWLADSIIDLPEGAWGSYVLELDVPEHVLEPHEWLEEGKGYREFLVPAEVVNRYQILSVQEDPYLGGTSETQH